MMERETGDNIAIVLVLLVVFFGFFFIWLAFKSEKFPDESRFRQLEKNAYYTVYVDTYTGIEYFKSGNSMTPVYDVEGKPYISNGYRDYAD